MKRLILLLVFIPSVGFSQTFVNNDSLVYYFKYILNNYRVSHGLQPVEIDGTLKGFTDNWSKQMSITGIVGHGSGNNAFQQRISDCKCFQPETYCGENCTEIYTPSVSVNSDVSCTIKNIEPYIKKSFSGKITQYELAYFVFLNFKNSPPHNAFLLDKNVKYFFISGTRGNEKTYVSYIARS